MINLMLGPSGGGKSYESVVFHVLPALQMGRLVITNLPLVVEEWAKLDPLFPKLIEFRTKSKGPDVDGAPAPVFSHLADYGSPWRAQRKDENGDPMVDEEGEPIIMGPLYVIDECHKALPARSTPRAVEEWYAEHRHENADCLLITQSYGKVSKAIVDNVQMVYRCRKAVALGFMNRYVKKVQDGIRGEVMSEAVRTYSRKYFKLYRSHTRGVSAQELGAQDVRPWWKHWSFIGAGVCLVIVTAMFASGKVGNPLKPEAAKGKPSPQAVAGRPQAGQVAAPVAKPASGPASGPRGAFAKAEEVDPEPFAGRGLHVTGYLEAGKRKAWTFALSQNGQRIASITDAELVAAGYTWRGESQCSGVATFGTKRRIVVCDTPQVGPVPSGRSTGAPSTAAT